MAEPESAHEKSGEVENAVLELFSIPDTDTSLDSYRIVPQDPTTTTSITPIEFNIPGGREYVDLTRSYFRMKVNFKKAAGGNLVAAESLWGAPNLFHTMIAQPSVYLNGKLVSEQTDTYAYKAYLETLLNYSKEAGETHLRTQGWYEALDHPTVLTAANIDKGTPNAAYTNLEEEPKKALNNAWKLQDRMTAGKDCILISRPHIDIFNVNRLIIPGVDLKIRFTMNVPDFFMNGVALHGRLKPEDIKMTLHLCLVRLRSDKFKEISAKRLGLGKTIYYPTVRSEIRVFPIPNGKKNFEANDVFNGRIPDRVVLGMVHQLGYHGEVTRNPFCFEKFNLSSIKQVIEGEEYPYQTLNLNHDKGQQDIDGYHRLIMASCLDNKQECMINPDHWGEDKNTTLFMWDNVA